MESWSYISEGRSFIPNESLSPSELPPRSKNAFMNWEWRDPSSFSNTSLLVPHQEAQTQPGFGELDSLHISRRQNPYGANNQVFGDKIVGGRSTNQIIGTLNALSREDDSVLKFSSCVVDSKNRDSSLIDLKLGRLGDVRDSQNSKLSARAPFLPSMESCVPAKRVRGGGVNSQTACCQVFGCDKDLSSSKDYHKRHKVCEIHSKTPKVIVNGIEQRFCQQCSRFHLLAEFDDDKRSCRKRLAGHNERRRKPQVGIHSGRSAKPLLSYNGNNMVGNPLAAPSFICQDILPHGDLFNGEKYGRNNWCGYVKAEDGKDPCPLSTVPTLQSKSPISSYSFEKQFPLFHDNGRNPTPSSNLIAGSLYQQNMGGPNSAPHCFFSENSLNSEDFSVFDTASTIQGLSGISESGCALSLLSSQSQNSSSHSSGIPVAQSLVHPSNQMHFSSIQDSSKLIGLRLHPSISGVSNKLSLSGMDSAEHNHPDAMLLSNCNGTANFDISNGIPQGPDISKRRNNLSCENGSTIDLLQLSSQLQRVEDQRLSLQVKQENDGFCGHQIT